ncbi:MAG: hypothetical protein ACK54G_04330, partial [Pseudanabaena sp.]
MLEVHNKKGRTITKNNPTLCAINKNLYKAARFNTLLVVLQSNFLVIVLRARNAPNTITMHDDHIFISMARVCAV